MNAPAHNERGIEREHSDQHEQRQRRMPNRGRDDRRAQRAERDELGAHASREADDETERHDGQDRKSRAVDPASGGLQSHDGWPTQPPRIAARAVRARITRSRHIDQCSM
jgi:hypothetical protein